MITGDVKLEGVAPRNRIVGVYDREQKLIAQTTADDDGNWCIPSKSLPIGQHFLRAVVTNDDGRTVAQSRDCRVEVYEPGECEVIGGDMIVADSESRSSRRNAYVEMTLALDRGEPIDAAEIRRITDAAGFRLEELEEHLAILAETE